MLERLEQEAEEKMDRLVAAYFDALTADRSWFDSNGEPHSSADYAMRLKAADSLVDRLLGKAKQSVEMEHSGGVTIEALFAIDPLAATHTELPEDAA